MDATAQKVSTPPPVRPGHDGRRIRPRLRKLLLTCHITLSVGWLGVEAAQVVLGGAGLLTGNPAHMRAVYLVMELLGTTLVPPLAVGSLLTGILLGLGTPWGLLSHYWMLAKLSLNLALIVNGHFVLRHWLEQQAERALAVAPDSLTGPHVGAVRVQVLAGVGVSLAVLVTAATLSVYKPWGRTRFGRRDASTRLRIGSAR
jgi:hypothetical protein